MTIIQKHLGVLSLLFSIFLIIPIITAIIYSESIFPYIFTAIISLLFGWMLLSKKEVMETKLLTSLDIPRSITICALTFIVISLIGAIPFLFVAKTTLIDAIFESFSGFTTTGLTILTDIDHLPKSLLMWRAETQWIGGLGIVLLFLMIVLGMRRQDSLQDTTTKARAIATLYQAQGASEKLESNMKKSIKKTALIYFAYTILGIILLMIVGLTAFESIAISFTAISTAGFSVTDQFYTDTSVVIVVLFLIIAGAVSFVVHNKIVRRQFKEFLNFEVFRFYLFFIFLMFMVMYLSIKDLKVAIFQTVTAATTTGYTITDIALMPHIAIMIIMIGMIIGGMIGSTAGGIKINRLLLSLKSIPWMIKKTAAPRGTIIPLKIDGKEVEDGTIWITHAYMACYVLILVVGVIIMMLSGISFLDSSFQMASALGGVGLSSTSLVMFGWLAKVLLIIAMMFGRLEIFPVLIIGKYWYDSSRKSMRRSREEARKAFYGKVIPSRLWKRK